jgi:ribosomal protein L6P/L9E
LRNILIIKVGFSHKILLKLNSTIDVVIKKKKKKLILSGANLNMINKFIYILSNLKKISYYKKKGLYFYKHNIKLKEGKIRK